MKQISKYLTLDDFNSVKEELNALKNFLGYVVENKKPYVKHVLTTNFESSTIYVDDKSSFVVNGRLYVKGNNVIADIENNRIIFE